MIHPPETGTVGLSWRAYLAIAPVIIVAVALHMAVFYVLESFNLPLVIVALIDSAITALVAFAAHNYVVTGGARRGFRALKSDHSRAFFSFLVLSIGVVLAMHGFGWFVDTAIAPMLAPADTSQVEFPSSSSVALSFGIAILFVVAVFVIIGGFGTMFPAIVDGGDTSPGMAWRRGVKGPIVYRLIGAALITSVIGLVISALLLALLGGDSMHFSINLDHVFSTPRGIILAATNMLLTFYMTTLVATILSKAYLGSYTTKDA